MLSEAQQTMQSWARVVESYDAVPTVYRNYLATLLGATQVFPYVVITPAQAGYFHKTTAKLICEVNNTIYVLEQVGHQIVAKGYPLKAIRDVEVGIILLYAWITISGVTTEGIATTSTFVFNSVTESLFTPLVNHIRSISSDVDAPGVSTERAKFDYLMPLSFKFMNYGKSSLLAGEKVMHIVWQPEIRGPVVSLLGWAFNRTISTAHLIILTDKEMILIREDERVGGNRDFRYGGVWQYIPLRSIVSISLSKQADDLCKLSVFLFDHGRLDQMFTVANQDEVAHLQTEFAKLIR